MQISEIARIKRQIVEECQAAKNGLTGVAFGVSQHAFINARLEKIGEYHEELKALIGEEEGVKFLAEMMEVEA